MLAIIVILSVSEESMMNAASAETACGLCLARRRKTNAVQSNICIVSIQILRRSAPQNDKLLNCSQTPQQTGICNWRQPRKVEGKRCSERSRLAEINTGFSRASRSPAMRRLAKLAPPASARKYLQHCSQNRTRLRLAQLCELPRKQQIPLILPRHYTASGLLNLHTSLTRALTPVTPGVKLPEPKIARKSHAT